jgi:hypothetical protein
MGCLLDVIGVCSVVELDLIFTVLEEFYILRLELYVKRKVIILICCVLSLQSFDAISLFKLMLMSTTLSHRFLLHIFVAHAIFF